MPALEFIEAPAFTRYLGKIIYSMMPIDSCSIDWPSILNRAASCQAPEVSASFDGVILAEVKEAAADCVLSIFIFQRNGKFG